ncbi:MAG: apolipoprotein N-acyltransferase [Alphaproteobacteria bacterium]
MLSRKALLSLLAGAAASFALPPFGIFPAIWCLAYPAVQFARAEQRSQALWIIAASGLGWFTASTHWIAHSLLVGEAEFWYLLPLAAVGLPAVLALFWVGAGAVAWRRQRSAAARLGWLLLCLAIAEFARGHVATGFPWNSPGYSFSAHLWLLQAASWFGLYGLTCLALAFALAPSFWRVGHRRLAMLFIAIPLALALMGGLRLGSESANPAAVKQVRLVQPVIAQAEKWDRAKRGQHLSHIVRTASAKTPIPQLMIWPETAFSAFASRDGSLLTAMAQQALPFDGHLITGMPRLDEAGRLFNSAALVTADGQITATYDKRRLVPFGEFAPFRRFLPFVDAIAGPRDFSAGTGERLFTVPGYGKIALLICYESIFPGEIGRGGKRPDLIVNITNDAWFGRTLGPWQHLAQSRMRAVEEGIPMMRVANNGISAGFDSHGRILGQIALDAVGTIDLSVPSAVTPTIFARYGNAGFFGLLMLAGFLFIRLDQKPPIRQ